MGRRSTLFRSKQKTAYEIIGVTGVQTCALPIRSEEHTSELQSHDNLLCRIIDRKSTRLNSSHTIISYAVFCLKKKKKTITRERIAYCNCLRWKNLHKTCTS